jgi:hypothetical protein
MARSPLKATAPGNELGFVDSTGRSETAMRVLLGTSFLGHPVNTSGKIRSKRASAALFKNAGKAI